MNSNTKERVIHEETTERWTGCWFQCGQRVDHGQPRVRVRPPGLLFHPECFKKWERTPEGREYLRDV